MTARITPKYSIPIVGKEGRVIAYCMAMFSVRSIYLPIRLNPRGGHQTSSGEPSAGGK